jgi:hypothetical protein
MTEVWLVTSQYEDSVDAVCATLEGAVEYASPGKPWRVERAGGDTYYGEGYWIARHEVLP